VSRDARTLCAVLFVAAALPAPGLGAIGGLDPTFGGDGKVRTDFAAGPDEAVGVAVQPSDGRIVAAGWTVSSGGRFAVTRYEPGGGLDSSFGGDGKVATNFTGRFDAAFDVAVRAADGKIVAVGRAAGLGGRFAVARYTGSGRLDTTFSGDGKVTTNFSAGDDFAFGVAVQADGKIVAVGRAGGLGGRFAAARYRDNGSLDPGFSGDGKATTNFTRGDDRADLLAVQADGRIVAAGTAGYAGGNARFALVRYEADGSLDSSFGGDAKVTTNFVPGFDGAFAVAAQPADQKIVAAGQVGGGLGLARYLPGGGLDSSFGGDGKVTTNFTRGLDYADDVELDSGGRIVAAGSANFFGSDPRFAVARYEADGSLDPSFGGDGRVTTNLTPGRDWAFGVALQPGDGKIVAAGRARGGFALARYLVS
jgi:uncharacterized delta-60 repeat protein